MSGAQLSGSPHEHDYWSSFVTSSAILDLINMYFDSSMIIIY